MLLILLEIEEESIRTIYEMMDLLGDSFERLKPEVRKRISTFEISEQINRSLNNSADEKYLKDRAKLTTLLSKITVKI